MWKVQHIVISESPVATDADAKASSPTKPHNQFMPEGRHVNLQNISWAIERAISRQLSYPFRIRLSDSSSSSPSSSPEDR